MCKTRGKQSQDRNTTSFEDCPGFLVCTVAAGCLSKSREMVLKIRKTNKAKREGIRESD